MPLNKKIKSVLIIGNGPIVIGQACEFDYSGSQAIRSLKEENIEVILINSNPATIMTDHSMSDHVYLQPLEKQSIIEILNKHKIDAVLATMGGQTALNLAIECHQCGIWEKYDVEMIGVDIEAIEVTENREKFRQKMIEIQAPVCEGKTAKSFLEGKEIAQEIGFPLVLRPSFTLAGTGGGFVEKIEDFDVALHTALHASPIHEVLVEKSVLGWKEFELELLRDAGNNMAIICSIENMDPMGIHTGDSITTAPALTLPDTIYQKMRDLAKKAMEAIGNFSGGCNIQFALSPDKEEIIVIEINPRVSRSSALASKATGYPIAKIATKLAIGYFLDEIKNPITQTSAYFEPSLDYVVVKIPRWNFDKFIDCNQTLGLQMKSVGEVMGMGRSFQESLQKACQSLEIKVEGITGLTPIKNGKEIIKSLKEASWDRLFRIYDAFRYGIPFDTIFENTKIDPWFLYQIQDLFMFEKKLSTYQIETIDKHILLEAKKKGFSDQQLAVILKTSEEEILQLREKYEIKRAWKRVDTCAAEFPTKTAYYYSCFGEENESIVSQKEKIIVIGSGPNRIGQGIEFDYCCVHGVLAIREMNYEAIMINCNPETVSTDWDISDKLYFEPIFWEHIIDIINHEKPLGVIVQLGGQTALKMAEKLDAKGIKIIGTDFKSLNLAEDRGYFSTLLKKNKIPYPQFATISTATQAIDISDTIGFPMLVRPSYVLGGQGMRIVINKQELEEHIIYVLQKISGKQNRILLDHFLENAIEAEVDAICDGEEVMILGIMQHIEPAGIHSGDSHALLPPYNLGDLIIEQIKEYTKKIALALKTVGLINIQFVIKEDIVYVIEANPRASRTVPFICKAHKIPYIHYAIQVMLGKKKIKDFTLLPQLKGYAIKIPVFSFDKFVRVNKELGPEMKSTGEAIYFIDNLKDDFFRKIYMNRNLFLSR